MTTIYTLKEFFLDIKMTRLATYTDEDLAWANYRQYYHPKNEKGYIKKLYINNRCVATTIVTG